MEAFTGSRGRVAAVSDEQILDAYRFLAAHEGVFCEPASAASVAGLLTHGAEDAERIVCVLTGNGLKDPQTALSQAGAVVPVRAGDGGGREGRPGCIERRRTVRVPASSANLGPGFDVMGAALDLHLEVDVVETGQFAVHTDLRIARDKRNLIVRGFAGARARRRLRVHDPVRHPALRRAGHERGGDRRRPGGRGLDLRARRRRAGRGDEDRRPPGQRGGRDPRRLRAVRGRPRGALRAAARPRMPARGARHRGAHAEGPRSAPLPDPDGRRRVQHRARLDARARPRPR